MKRIGLVVALVVLVVLAFVACGGDKTAGGNTGKDGGSSDDSRNHPLFNPDGGVLHNADGEVIPHISCDDYYHRTLACQDYVWRLADADAPLPSPIQRFSDGIGAELGDDPAAFCASLNTPIKPSLQAGLDCRAQESCLDLVLNDHCLCLNFCSTIDECGLLTTIGTPSRLECEYFCAHRDNRSITGLTACWHETTCSGLHGCLCEYACNSLMSCGSLDRLFTPNAQARIAADWETACHFECTDSQLAADYSKGQRGICHAECTARQNEPTTGLDFQCGLPNGSGQERSCEDVISGYDDGVRNASNTDCSPFQSPTTE